MANELSGVAVGVTPPSVGAGVGTGANGTARTSVTKADDGGAAAKDAGQAKEAAAKGDAVKADATKAEARKTAQHSEPLHGFNPSIRIDSDTHMVVMTVRDPSGNVVRQIPNEHELAAYKADVTQHLKK